MLDRISEVSEDVYGLAMSTEIDFGYQLGAVQTWGAFERRLAWVSALAHLLKPTEPEERQRVQRVLLAAGLKQLKEEAKDDERRTTIFEEISTAIGKDVSSIATSKASGSYMKSLKLDLDEAKPGDRSGSIIGAVLGSGLIVRTMYDHRSELMGPDGAKQKIVDNYKTTALFDANYKSLKDAWTANRSIAPFAAALLEHLSVQKLRKFRTSERAKLRTGIATYFRHALCFQQFLFGLKKSAPRLRFPIDDILTIPAALKIEPLPPNGELWLPPEALKQSLARRKLAT